MKEVDSFNEQRLASTLTTEFDLSKTNRLFVAFSGGLDSTVLLHALINTGAIPRQRITALHVNHGAHPDADRWQLHCRRMCQAWGVPFKSFQLNRGTESTASGEANLRRERYAWFARLLHERDVLLTAHHQDDQVETILANLLRGTGVGGMTGIPGNRALGRGRVWRPLLDVPRNRLREHARLRGLSWIEDPANVDHRYTRNYLRHQVLPMIKRTWPAAVATIARNTGNWRDAKTLLDELAKTDLARIAQRNQTPFCTIHAVELGALSRARCTNLLRFWLEHCGFASPLRRHLLQVHEQMIATCPKATAVLGWPGAEVRRYGDWLYFSSPLARDPIAPVDWDPARSGVVFGDTGIEAVAAMGRGIKRAVYDSGNLSIRIRRGGERCLLPGHRHHQKLKKLLQQAKIPPWQRDRIPLLYVDDSLAAVIGLWYCQPFAAQEQEPGMEFRLVRTDKDDKDKEKLDLLY